jgi:hypothetical protein
LKFTKRRIADKYPAKQVCSSRKHQTPGQKEYFRVDTAKTFDRPQQCVLGRAIVVGLRRHPPSAPSLRAADQYKWSLIVAGKNDTINQFLPLSYVSLDGTSHQAHYRGIDFMYDPSPKPEGRLSLRFCRSNLSDSVVRQVLNLKPFDANGDSDGSRELQTVARNLNPEY